MKAIAFIKKEPMLALSLLAAAIGFIITPPSLELIGGIDWRTLGTLLMMLTVLEGFKKENVLYPVVRLGSKLGRMTSLTLFLVFGVFFSSMFITNDVSLLIFVPLTITLFRAAGKEKYILPVISMENIAAIRGSLLMPFGSPQNLFLYGKAEASLGRFMLHMSPLCVMSAVLLVAFIFFLYRKDPRESAAPEEDNGKGGGELEAHTAQRGLSRSFCRRAHCYRYAHLTLALRFGNRPYRRRDSGYKAVSQGGLRPSCHLPLLLPLLFVDSQQPCRRRLPAEERSRKGILVVDRPKSDNI